MLTIISVSKQFRKSQLDDLKEIAQILPDRAYIKYLANFSLAGYCIFPFEVIARLCVGCTFH